MGRALLPGIQQEVTGRCSPEGIGFYPPVLSIIGEFNQKSVGSSKTDDLRETVGFDVTLLDASTTFENPEGTCRRMGR
jgi:hypothetical protein